MGFLHATGDFLDYKPGLEIIGARLITVDAENVLTAYGNPQLREGALGKLRELGSLGTEPHVVVATNNSDPEFVGSLADQLDPHEIQVFSGLDYANKKTSPGMFLAAASSRSVDVENAVHIDDQYLSFRGAKMAGYRGGVLVRPYGSTDHLGVKAGRIIDESVRRGLIVAQGLGNAMGLVRNGIDG